MNFPSAIDKGAMVSAAPAQNPMNIRAAKKLPYDVVKESQSAATRYKGKLARYIGRRPYLLTSGIRRILPVSWSSEVVVKK